MASTEKVIRVERTIGASPEVVWGLVTDVTRMGEWSTESTGAKWVGGAGGPAVGARFKGRNQNGSKKWQTDCVVTACDPSSRFAFEVKAGPMRVARWSYEMEPVDGGCRVVEQWDDQRGLLLARVAPIVTGTKDRVGRNRETMTATLDAVAAEAERIASNS
jgi:uncharacterized protein YndB with AHSA1/START domain